MKTISRLRNNCYYSRYRISYIIIQICNFVYRLHTLDNIILVSIPITTTRHIIIIIIIHVIVPTQVSRRSPKSAEFVRLLDGPNSVIGMTDRVQVAFSTPRESVNQRRGKREWPCSRNVFRLSGGFGDGSLAHISTRIL